MRTVAACVAVAVVGLCTACGKGSKEKDTPRAPVKHDAGIAPVDWTACDAALAQAPTRPDTERAAAVIAGCQVCGDWTPVLDWNRRHEDGGPTRADIEAAMAACNAYCDAEAKDRFLGTLDNARGIDSVAPWRWLAKACKDKVSAVPDARFASPQLFALDRVARAAAAHGDTAALAKIDVPLPASSISGAGVVLASAHHLAPATPLRQLTITTGEVRTGTLPHGHLGSDGVAVDLGSAAYPGDLVDNVAAMPAGPYAVLAPSAMSAARVADVLATAPAGARLAAVAVDAPPAWRVPGVLPIDLVAAAPGTPAKAMVHVGDPAPTPGSPAKLIIAVRAADTVQQLTTFLDTLVSAGWSEVAIAREGHL